MIEISGYRLLRQLGRGGMATVYLAVQESVDREVALKVMSPALLADPNFGERFQREAKIAARLHHHHVVGIHDVSRAGDYHYIAMEYLAGGPVLHKDGNPRPVEFALRVIREIATALDYAHSKGFVHRDVKPDNILLRDDGSSALTDFGIARALDSSARMTKTGAVVGTPHYMSPEQARGKSIDGRSDLYSLGVVLYELLVGRVPYSADDSLAIGIMHITQPVPVLPDSIGALQPLVARMLAKQPEDRFQSGQEIAAAIAGIERDIRSGAIAEPTMPTESERRAAGYDTFVTVTPPPSDPGRISRERSEPNLGRLDEIIAAADDNIMRAERASRPERRGRRWLPWTAAAALVVVAGFAAWTFQDRLRALLPRTEFNDLLARAQHALDAGRLTGQHGDSARELYEAARAQDPDNDVARAGLEKVGQRLLARAQDDLRRNDLADARASLDAARELLGGGTSVDALSASLDKAENEGAEASEILDQANAALAAGRITGDEGAAALYQKLLATDASNALAQSGLRKSADVLAGQARDALAAGDADTAGARIDDIARILPTSPELGDLRGALTQLRANQSAELEKALDRADGEVRKGHLAGGDDSALALYRDVLAKDPGNERATKGLRRVAQAFVVQANAAVDGDHPTEAERLIASASELAPDLAELREAKINLRELRERLAIDAQRPVVTPAQVAEIRKLDAAADQAAEAGKLIIPPGDSAYDKYRAALALDGNDRAALDGLARLPARAKTLFEKALTDSAPQRARAMLDTVRQLAPEDPSIGSMTERLAGAFLDEAESRVREGRRDDAARALDAARELSPVNPRLAPLEARIRALPPAGRQG